jgi:hypothetical protein
MYIKLTKIDRDADMAGYDAIEVFGTKLEDGSEWSKPFFANNNELINELDNFSVGEEVNVVMEQNKKFWNIVGFKEMTAQDRENLNKPRGSGNSKAKGGSGSSGGMTKAEWAEKDRVTAARIARAVALKAAVDNLKEGATVNTIFKRADEFLNYLEDAGTVKTEDPLDPPE